MNRHRYFNIYAVLLVALILAGWVVTKSWAQSASSGSSANITADQQKQLDNLKQLEEQLRSDRTAVHDAIAKYGWDSDQVDEARAQLFQNRQEYRKLRRLLRQSGVAVPAAQGFGARPNCPGPGGRMMGRMGRGGPGGGPGGCGRRAWRRAGCPCRGM